ncbi:uncharacterized protein F4812DRAFT_414051 [Daldinia caldariorum]|uniref:uncharacterized protein n=1 Tax=Daldinia caldariorum TaxID=326644 RepID=UPI002007D253|nr:uncharacterized protein F4812DRAFT_414051 [Daldinia caldariorum]KAI1471433.1 hypothetical protein F4812DRAFT_414051 [Daldinia caldariorum]
MNKFGAALLLSWSLWSTVGAGLDDATLNTDSFDRREQENRLERVPTISGWPIIPNDEIGEGQRRQHQPQSLLSTAVVLSPPTTTTLGNSWLQHRQASGKESSNEEGDDDGEKGDRTPKSPADVVSSMISSRVSSGVSSSVSSSVAASVSAAFSVSLAEVSASASSAVSSAREAARTQEALSSITVPSPPKTTGASTATSSQAASTTSDRLPAVSATTADVSNIEESAITASQPSTPTSVPTQGSSITPGVVAGLVVGISIASALLSAIITYLFMRRRARQQQQQQQEPQNNFLPSSPPPSNSHSSLGGHGFVNHSHSHSLSNDFSQFQMIYTSPTPTNHNRAAANLGGDFTPDMKQRFTPTPTQASTPAPAPMPTTIATATTILTPVAAPPITQYPATAQTTQQTTQLSAPPPARRISRFRTRPRTLSDPSVDGGSGLDPVFPVSPLSSDGDGPYSSRTDRRPSPLSYEGGGGGNRNSMITRTTSARAALARQQSISANGGQRAHLVRVGSERGAERDGAGYLAAAAGGGGVGQGEGLTRLYSFTTDSENGNSTGSGDAGPQQQQQQQSYLQPRPLVKYALSSSPGSTSPGLQVQAPVPRRPVDPYYFEKGTHFY